MKELNDTYRFTPETKSVIDLAQQEARQLRHDFVGTEHLLLALLRDKEGSAVHILEQCGTNTIEVNQKTMHMLYRNFRPSFVKMLKTLLGRKKASIQITDALPFTRRARLSLGLAAQEAKRKGNHSISDTDLLLGLVSEGGIAAMSLQALSIDASAIRAHL